MICKDDVHQIGHQLFATNHQLLVFELDNSMMTFFEAYAENYIKTTSKANMDEPMFGSNYADVLNFNLTLKRHLFYFNRASLDHV